MKERLLERFLRYARINTRSDENSDTVPSTKCQITFLKQLAEEIGALGFSEVEYNEANSIVTATIPANTDADIPVMGFIAHIDTADFNAENINPQIHENYQGDEIALDSEGKYILSPAEFPNLKNYIGQTLITTDGTTLLGADDKSGVVEIIEAGRYLLEHPEIKHGKIRFAFTPDEEIGRGVKLFDVEGFGAEFAYTMDGGAVGELEYESFNAAQAKIKIQGQNVHPGSAKNKMINALELVAAVNQSLPMYAKPEYTSGREGFFHLYSLSGTVDEAEMVYIIRDHSRENFEEKKAYLTRVVEELNTQIGRTCIQLDLRDQYYNMAEVIEKDMTPVELAEQAMKNLDIEPKIEAIRGGTDGSILSFMGLPTPNIFAGGENFHGRFEFVSLEAMELATQVIIEIVRLASEGAK